MQRHTGYRLLTTLPNTYTMYEYLIIKINVSWSFLTFLHDTQTIKTHACKQPQFHLTLYNETLTSVHLNLLPRIDWIPRDLYTDEIRIL